MTNGSYSFLDIQDKFKIIMINKYINEDNMAIQVYINEIENRVTFKIKFRYSLQLLAPDTIKLLTYKKGKH